MIFPEKKAPVSLIPVPFKRAVKKGMLYLSLLCAIILFSVSSYAQKHCDLAIHILTPADGEEIPYGDTVDLNYSIVNLGPDTLDITDTIFIANSLIPFFSVIWPDSTIIPGDSLTATIISAWNDESEDAVVDICIYLDHEWNTTFTDSAQSNDTSCVYFIMEGSGDNPSNIAATGNPSPAQLNIYPNPASAAVFITIPANVPGKPEIAVYDLSGRLIMQRAGILQRSGNEIKVDVSMLPKGMYLLKLQTPGTAQYGKLLVQ